MKPVRHSMLASVALTVLASQAFATDLAITNARLFDAVDGSVREDATILIDGNRITEITEGAAKADRVIDAGGRFVMPGMADGHSHQFFDITFDANGMTVHFPKSDDEGRGLHHRAHGREMGRSPAKRLYQPDVSGRFLAPHRRCPRPAGQW